MEWIILFAILIYFLRKNKKANHYQTKKNYKKRHLTQPQWHSDWVWNEEKQLWIHPLSGDTPTSLKTGKTESQDVVIDFSTAYQAKYLLTKNEWAQYKKLKVIADEKGYG